MIDFLQVTMRATFGKQQVFVKRAKMEIDAPLKPPEYKRDGMGRFERRADRIGRDLQIKNNNADLIKKTDDIKRDHKGRFEQGTHGGPRAGAGRPPGSKNKTTLALKEAILQALENAGGKKGAVGYLERLAIENSSAFASLVSKVLPSTLASDSDGGGVGVQLVFRREIVYPNGHVETEGVTPKQLPPPDDYPLAKADEPNEICSDINQLDD